MPRNASVELKLYVAGAVMCGLLLVFFIFGGPKFTQDHPVWALMLEVTGPGSFIAGFLIFWLWPRAAVLWATTARKWLLGVISAAILFLAGGLSPELVAVALGLPPSDFQFSVTFWAIVFWVLIWLVLASLFLALVTLCFEAKNILASTGITTSSWINTGRRFGVFLLFFACWFVIAGYGVVISRLQEPVRWVAYVTEYHPMAAYPGLEPSRAKLHENGVVSYAEIKGWRVTIRVEKLPP